MNSEKHTYKALIIDNDPDVSRVLLASFARRGIHGTVSTNRRRAGEYLDANPCHIVFISDALTRTNQEIGTTLMARIRSDSPEMPVIVVSDSDSPQRAMEAFHNGCAEFLVKPLTGECVEDVLDTFLPNHKTKTLAGIQDYSNRHVQNIIGSSTCLSQSLDIAAKAAPTSAPVLITGESGTGKELIAQYIHQKSRRNRAPFIKVNCAALNESLLESELFGHEKGAFTGAHSRHIGRFERAHGGTLLLDEITETPPAFQAKLLRVLEEMDFERVGGAENININVRIISTTNLNIQEKVEEGKFRRDLYYRLAGIRIDVPPLRDRLEDLHQLVWHFINQFAPEARRKITKIDPVMIRLFEDYAWPGNIRQLRNTIRTAMILGNDSELSLADAPWLTEELRGQASPACDMENQLAGVSLHHLERQAILATLKQTEGNQAQAARVLGISDRTLRDKVKKYRQQGLLEPVGSTA